MCKSIKSHISYKTTKMRTCLLGIFLLFGGEILAQNPKSDNAYEDVIYGVTTIINAYPNDFYKAQGTGFFFHEYKADSLMKYDNPINANLKNVWLVTNNHVLFGDDFKSHPIIPKAIQFYLRRKQPNKPPKWDTITIKKVDFLRLVKSHPNADVAAINITEFVKGIIQGDTSYIYNAVSKVNFPYEKNGLNVNSEYELQVGREIISLGYPKEFYDTYNLYPTVKSGMIASKWKANYNGERIFLIDSKLFPGSSGSLIITKPHTYSVSENGGDFFLVLGVFSGEYLKSEQVDIDDLTIIKRGGYNTGIVWYYDVLNDIIGH